MGLFTGSDTTGSDKSCDSESSVKDVVVKSNCDNDDNGSRELSLTDSIAKSHRDMESHIAALSDSFRDVFNTFSDLGSSSIWNDLKTNFDFFKDNDQFFGEKPSSFFSSDESNFDDFFNGIRIKFFSNPFSLNYQPLGDQSTGYWAYPSPSAETYEACKKKDGLSVWNENGYWRCLFPRAIIPPEKLNSTLTKEDVLEDKNNEKGLFFQDFNKYLDWKAHMRRLQREEREEKYKQLKNHCKEMKREMKSRFRHRHHDPENDGSLGSAGSTGSTLEKFNDNDNDNTFGSGKVVEVNSKFHSYVNDNGKKEEFSRYTKVFKDGSSTTTEIKKTFGNKGEEPLIEKTVHNFPSPSEPSTTASNLVSEPSTVITNGIQSSSSTDDASGTGWFWNSSSDDK
ncbi:hypothetical protein PACTADRAFT_36118 [Pachysolen tannophilus NRRL Y-2460]|uniref:Uncharacterized protein n=1 Tax=Pachysolen tannophilus NRRL Y-2460 TaxID=669874 RepID=A0A1E4TP15_PACTA|nr:hypothetical protein PACTADRAFT_36118 [Pachysolen tannophilus NRRL Y-2460]